MQAIEEIILGNSLVIKEMKKLIEMVSSSNTTVLIQGETGTGKELGCRGFTCSFWKKRK